MTSTPAVVHVDRNGLEVLDRPACLRLLATATIGRIGVSSGALPVILPVNFRLIHEQVMFRSGVGTKLDAASCNQIVAFEVDAIDPMFHTGWSVLVTGMAREVTDQNELASGAIAGIPHWATAGDERMITIGTSRISGRRILEGPKRLETMA